MLAATPPLHLFAKSFFSAIAGPKKSRRLRPKKCRRGRSRRGGRPTEIEHGKQTEIWLFTRGEGYILEGQSEEEASMGAGLDVIDYYYIPKVG